MESQTVVIALLVAGVAAFLIIKFGSGGPKEHRPEPTSTATTDADEPVEELDHTQPNAYVTGPLRRRGRSRRRRGAGGERAAALRRAGSKTTVDAELLRTLEELAAHPQNRAAAINLLRQRTGMSYRQARRFINAL